MKYIYIILTFLFCWVFCFSDDTRPEFMKIQFTDETVKAKYLMNFLSGYTLKNEDKELAQQEMIKIKDSAFPVLVNALASPNVMRALAGEDVFKKMDTQATEVLIKCLSDTRGSVRVMSAYILGETKDKKSSEACVNGLSDTLWNVRGLCARALGNMEETLAEEFIIPLLSDTDKEVRTRAVIAVGRMKNVNSIKNIVPLLEDDYYNVRGNAVRALSFYGDTGIPYYIDYFRQSETKKKILYLRVFGLMKSDRSIQHIASCLKDSYWAVRLTAVNLLESLGKKEYLANAGLQDDVNLYVRHRVNSILTQK